MWKVSQKIVDDELPGWRCLCHILRLAKKQVPSGDVGSQAQKYPRALDMTRRVSVAKAAISSKTPMSIYDNVHMKSYLEKLDNRHLPPTRLERSCIIEVLSDGTYLELGRILGERRDELYDGFVNAALDFWTGSARKEAYGALVLTSQQKNMK